MSQFGGNKERITGLRHGLGESAGEVGRGRNEDVKVDVWCYKDGHNREWNNRGNKSGRKIQENAGKRVKVVGT